MGDCYLVFRVEMETKLLFSLLEAYSFWVTKKKEIKKCRNENKTSRTGVSERDGRHCHGPGEMKRHEWLPMSMYKG